MKLTIPFYLHKAGAGFPSPATDYIEEDVDLNAHLIKNVPATFVIRVQGKSMIDVGIYDGDLLVVDRSLEPKNFSTVVANVHDELVVKNFIKSKNQNSLKICAQETPALRRNVLLNLNDFFNIQAFAAWKFQHFALFTWRMCDHSGCRSQNSSNFALCYSSPGSLPEH